jgi:hypothetical protein
MVNVNVLPPTSKEVSPAFLLDTETANDTSYTIKSHISIKEPPPVKLPHHENEQEDTTIGTNRPTHKKWQDDGVLSSVINSTEFQNYCKTPNQKSSHRKNRSGVGIYAKRLAESFRLNAHSLMGDHPERCVMVTVTLRDHLSYYSEKDQKEASRRMSSWINNKGGFQYVFGGKRQWCRVIGAQPRTGRIHWHLIVALDEDVGTGVDHEAVKKRDDYTTIGPYLKRMWKRMKISGKRYGLGKVVQILPVENKDAVALYLSGHITEDSRNRIRKGEGKSSLRKVAYSHGWADVKAENVYRMGTGNWKRGLDEFMKIVGVPDYDDLKKVIGPRWARYNREFIFFLGKQQTA